jgi:endonuclease-3 related protein
MEMYEAMVAEFGHLDWWPGDSPLEIAVGAILGQNTNWRNVEKAIANLSNADCMSITALYEMPQEQLAELIRPAGYYNVKAKRLKNFIATVYDSFGDDFEAFLDRSVSALSEDLLAVNGIGRETADSMILYAAKKTTFVVDTYTFRVLYRHLIIGPEDDYESVKDLMESSLPADAELFNDYHGQLVTIGKKYCKKTARCTGCPLEQFEHDPLAGSEQ